MRPQENCTCRASTGTRLAGFWKNTQGLRQFLHAFRTMNPLRAVAGHGSVLAGSEAPRRFGFCGCVAHELGACTAEPVGARTLVRPQRDGGLWGGGINSALRPPPRADGRCSHNIRLAHDRGVVDCADTPGLEFLAAVNVSRDDPVQLVLCG